MKENFLCSYLPSEKIKIKITRFLNEYKIWSLALLEHRLRVIEKEMLRANI
jgi:hypothetical protein